MNRRNFIQNGLGVVALGLSMPTLLLDATRAVAAEPNGAKKRDKILVVIEMSGGNDGLNTVAPLNDPLYLKARQNIGLKADNSVKIDNGLVLNPGMAALGKLYEGGKVAIVNGVGYPNPNRSHFASMDIWQSANVSIDATERSGWLARYFDEDGHFVGENAKNASLGSLAMGGNLPLALYSQSSSASVIGNGYNYGFDARGGDRDAQMATLKALYGSGELGNATVAAGSNQFLRNVGSEIYASTDAIRGALYNYDRSAQQKANNPDNNGLANDLRTVAKLISGDLPTRVYYVSIGGFDTHSDQFGHHQYLLSQLSEALGAFQEDMRLQGREKDVLVMTFSEFGRRVKENGSNGTDHGSASLMFLVGGGVKGGVHGAYPSLEDLDDGDLKMTTDFRSVYSAVLGNWLGANSGKILGGEFAPVALV